MDGPEIPGGSHAVLPETHTPSRSVVLGGTQIDRANGGEPDSLQSDVSYKIACFYDW